MSLIILQVIPCLIGYILIVLLLTVLPGPSSRSTIFDDELSLRWSFLIISFSFGQLACFGVCVVIVVPITSCFIIPLTWCRRWLITSSWNLSTNVSWSSSTFRAPQGYQLNSWWEIPSLPSMICVIIDHFIAFRSTQICSCFVLYLDFLAIQLMLSSTAEYCHLWCQECYEDCSIS